MSVCVRSAWV